MSRIGKLPIPLPSGVQVTVSEENLVTVKGKLGELSQAIDPAIRVKVEDGNLVLTRNTDEKQERSRHGLYRSLLANMVRGVSEGFTITQELVGVGYKAVATGQLIDLSLGYSHHIVIELAPEIKVETTAEKGKNPTIILKGIDRQLLGQVAAKIRSLRPPEPYKGKGIRFMGEIVRKKAGKSASDK
ncbi:MAG TPA: 50S ribosomal protein L6 [Bacteroidales bacterium]|nr:50S ribosomal protein L6 [Bacteroidales bacterium]HSA44242.1 50S ribosomal protein L6 [Bacteroidales bacterium]